MNNSNKTNQCMIHKQDCVVIDINPKSDDQSRYLCLKCLTSKIKLSNFSTVDDAHNYLSDIKKVYQQRKEIQNKKNLEVLKDIASYVTLLKNSYNDALEKIYENISQQMKIIEQGQESVNQKLQNIDIDSYLSSQNEFAQEESNYSLIKNIILSQLQKLSAKDYMTKCIETLQYLDCTVIKLIPEELSFQTRVEQERTPNLHLSCDTHKKEIILFDLNEQQQNENRLACISCISEKLGPFVEVSTVKKRWQDYEGHKKEILKDRKEEIKMKIGSVQSQLEQLLEKYSEIITQVLKSLSQRQINLQQQNEKVFNDPERDWLNLSKKEILDIADILSQPNHKEILKSELKQEFKQQDEAIIEIIKESLFCLGETEHQKLEKIWQVINFEERQQLFCQVETQTTVFTSSEIQCQIQPELKCFNEITQVYFEQKEVNPEQDDCQKNIKQSHKEIKNLVISTSFIKLIPANYQIITENSISQNGRSFEITFNKDSTIMVTGFESKIKIFSFQQGQLKEIQVLSEHTSLVCTFYFMKKTNQFISGSQDNSIRIWSVNDTQQWYCSLVLKDGHTNYVNKVIMNKNEDLIISCSYDYSIKFWVLKNEWECSQTLSVHSQIVWSICLNETENKLVSCGQDNQILITALDENNKWAVVQTIKVEIYGAKISFIEDDIITFQPLNGTKMDIFKLNEQSKLFEKSSEVKMEQEGGSDYWFQQQFIKEKQILLNQNGQSVHLIRKKSNDEFVIEQTIKFGNQNIWGAMTHDGEYLVTWDSISNQFQVRKQQN